MNHFYSILLIGASAGGTRVLKTICDELPQDFPLPIVVVLHRLRNQDSQLEDFLNQDCRLTVKEATLTERIQKGTIYLAPRNYHLLIEEEGSLSLSVEEPVSYARPSIDLLFESGALVYGPQTIGVILTGSNGDGAVGMAKIREEGGMTMVQDPKEAQFEAMPLAAIREAHPQHV